MEFYKRWWFWIVIVIILVLGIYIYSNMNSLPSNETCFKVVELENSFCPTLEKEQCNYYQNASNSIPGAINLPEGNCRWIEESSSCIGATRGCD